MKIENYIFPPKSSFLSVDKDMKLIADRILKNTRLQKMLYYPTKDAMDMPELTQQQKLELFNKNIKMVPKLYVDGSVLSYIIITFDNFTENAENPEFRDNVINFDIICHFDTWQMKDFELRPYRIAAELDSMLDNKHLTGIGTLQFLAANQMILSDEFAGLALSYMAIHGGEDKVNMPNPQNQARFEEDFNKIFNG